MEPIYHHSCVFNTLLVAQFMVDPLGYGNSLNFLVAKPVTSKLLWRAASQSGVAMVRNGCPGGLHSGGGNVYNLFPPTLQHPSLGKVRSNGEQNQA